jgi:hypothetical protein
LILVTNTVAGRQWKRELIARTSLTDEEIGEYSGERKEIRPVTIATYQVITRRTKGEYKHLELFDSRDWGLIIYDEVHLLPAPVFRVTANIQARRRLHPERHTIDNALASPHVRVAARLAQRPDIADKRARCFAVGWCVRARRHRFCSFLGHRCLLSSIERIYAEAEIAPSVSWHSLKRSSILGQRVSGRPPRGESQGGQRWQ